MSSTGILPNLPRLPETKTVFCDKDVLKEFNDWIKKNGNALATDNGGVVNWRNQLRSPTGKTLRYDSG